MSGLSCGEVGGQDGDPGMVTGAWNLGWTLPQFPFLCLGKAILLAWGSLP